jgi:hypothetical protein
MANQEREQDILSEEPSIEKLIEHREIQKYNDWPAVDELLPITMDNGFIIMNPIFNCTVCHAPTLYGNNLRGLFHVVPGGDLRLTGYGYCPTCKTMSTIRQHYRQVEDGTVYTQTIPRHDPIPLGGADIIPFERPKKKRRVKHEETPKLNEDGDHGC